MKSKLILPVILSVLWFTGASYYYLCIIKQVCPNTLKSSETRSNKKQLNEDHDLIKLPLSFRPDSEDPVIGEGFDDLRYNLLAKIGEFDTLIIQGVYTQHEEGGNSLASARAANVRSLLTDYLDSTRIKTDSQFDDMQDATNQELIEAIQFNIVSGQPQENTPEEDSIDSGNTQMVEFMGDEVIIHFPQGSVKKLITPDVDAYLDQLAADLLQKKDYKVFVEGHTDNDGDEATNYTLGRKRAWAIKKLMWDKGLDHRKIFTSSKGELEPLKSNSTEEGRAYNRRVELTFETE